MGEELTVDQPGCRGAAAAGGYSQGAAVHWVGAVYLYFRSSAKPFARQLFACPGRERTADP
jgi:hypothetical protein